MTTESKTEPLTENKTTIDTLLKKADTYKIIRQVLTEHKLIGYILDYQSMAEIDDVVDDITSKFKGHYQDESQKAILLKGIKEIVHKLITDDLYRRASYCTHTGSALAAAYILRDTHAYESEGRGWFELVGGYWQERTLKEMMVTLGIRVGDVFNQLARDHQDASHKSNGIVEKEMHEKYEKCYTRLWNQLQMGPFQKDVLVQLGVMLHCD